jgi:hypothetical protein
MPRSWLLLILSLAAATPAVARPAAPDSAGTAPELTQPSSRMFPPRISTLGVVYLPKARYSSETSLGLGGRFMRLFRLDGDARTPLSDIRFKAMYTFKGQKELEAVANLHSCGDCYALKLKVNYDDIPLRFWGLGPDSPSDAEEVYRPRSLLAYVELFRSLHPNLKVGVRYEYQQLRLKDTERGGLLAPGSEIPGTDGRHVMGAGVIAEWDTRDRRYSPTRGSYYQGFALWFDEELGSRYDFNTFHLDLRNYFPLAGEHVLATQVFLYSAMGGAPFWRFAALGGREHTRGYRKARHLDHTLLAVQGEYRFPLWGRLGGVAFGGLGDVAKTVGRMQFEHMRLTVGGGLRFQPRDAGGVKIRLDAGLGRRSLRFYLKLDEAF